MVNFRYEMYIWYGYTFFALWPHQTKPRAHTAQKISHIMLFI